MKRDRAERGVVFSGWATTPSLHIIVVQTLNVKRKFSTSLKQTNQETDDKLLQPKHLRMYVAVKLTNKLFCLYLF